MTDLRVAYRESNHVCSTSEFLTIAAMWDFNSYDTARLRYYGRRQLYDTSCED